ncbi:MAG: hypothetical protein ACRD0D_13440, partial [Acidimicrobiales bacterium]
MARAGELVDPPVPAPRALRPMLRFTRIVPRTLEAARRALDTEEGFRARVAEVARPAELGRAGWLYVARPEGWASELEGFLAAAGEVAEADRAESEERLALRRLRGAEE